MPNADAVGAGEELAHRSGLSLSNVDLDAVAATVGDVYPPLRVHLDRGRPPEELLDVGRLDVWVDVGGVDVGLQVGFGAPCRLVVWG